MHLQKKASPSHNDDGSRAERRINSVSLPAVPVYEKKDDALNLQPTDMQPFQRVKQYPGVLNKKPFSISTPIQRKAVSGKLQSTSQVVQFTLAKKRVVNVLKDLLKKHDLEAVYSTMWSDGSAGTIGEAIGKIADTTDDNVRRRLTEHPDIKPLLRGYRMTLATKDEKHTGDITEDGHETDDLNTVYNAFRALLFFHASKSADAIRESGLDPNFGGKEGGISDERSLPGKKAQNLAAAKGNVYVTRKFTEAKQYADNHDDRIIMLMVPENFQSNLGVDPDSQFGVLGSDYLKGALLADKTPNFYAQLYLLEKTAHKFTRDKLLQLWNVLISKNLIKP